VSTSSKKLLPAYLIIGEDERKQDVYVAEMKKRLDPTLLTFNLEELKASTIDDPYNLVVLLNTMPVGDDKRLVVITDADKLDKAARDLLCDYLKNPSPTSVLVLVAPDIPASSKLYQAIDALGKNAVLKCMAPKGRDLSGLVAQLSKREGISLNYEATQELIARVGTDTQLLSRQIKTLAAVSGNKKQLTKADVARLVARTAEEKPWKFLDALSARNAQEAMSHYQLMDHSAQLGLLTLVVDRIRSLICAHAYIQRGYGSSIIEKLQQELKKPKWQVEKYARWARGFRDGELEHLLAACIDVERSLKGNGDSDTAFVELILKICGRA
jgi:DNA polymerase-3 subunit delta